MTAEDSIATPNPVPSLARSNPSEVLGPLRGQVWLTIQTRQAQRLVRGRAATPTKPAIIGLVGFADRLRLIWQAARNDDPYADWWLVKVHTAIAMNLDDVRNWQREIRTLLQQMTTMDISIATSSQPYRMPLQFANPYAYQAAQLLSDYDALVCGVLTAHHVGLLDSEGSRGLINSCARKIRATFVIPQSYRFLKIDRATVRLQTGSSQKARHSMGEVPDDILSGERQAPLVPRKMAFSRGVAGHVGLRPEPSEPRTKHPDDENHDR